MPSFSKRIVSIIDLPFKLQAQKIKNVGKDNIYIFDIEDDLVLPAVNLVPFCQAIVMPGCEIDLVNHPFVNLSGYYFPDFDVCIHSLGHVEVDIVSAVWINAWVGDPAHPWNGAPMINGQLTHGWNQKQAATLNPSVQIPNIPLPSAPNVFWGQITGSPSSAPPVFKPLTLGTDYTETHYGEELSIQKECVCTTRTLMNAGCVCGHVKRKQWGLR